VSLKRFRLLLPVCFRRASCLETRLSLPKLRGAISPSPHCQACRGVGSEGRKGLKTFLCRPWLELLQSLASRREAPRKQPGSKTETHLSAPADGSQPPRQGKPRNRPPGPSKTRTPYWSMHGCAQDDESIETSDRRGRGLGPWASQGVGRRPPLLRGCRAHGCLAMVPKTALGDSCPPPTGYLKAVWREVLGATKWP